MSSKFAVFDIDGTVMRRQLYHKLVDKLAKQGALGAEAPQMLEEAEKSWKRRKLSEVSFQEYDDILVNVYENALQNISLEVFDSLAVKVIEEYRDHSYIYTTDLLRRLKSDGYKLFIISGSHTELIEQIGKYYDFDDWMGTSYERSDKGFTGNVAISTLDKSKCLRQLIERNNVSLASSVGIGDTSSDIPMLEMVENPIAFNPDQKLFKTARDRAWKIVIERKNVVYELESKDGRYELTS